MLNDDVATRFRAALRTHCPNGDGTHDELRSAVAAAAAEARRVGVSAEQFIIWVKHEWDGIADEGLLANSTDPGQIRDVVISSAIKAYYVQ